MDQEFLEVVRTCCALEDQAALHLDERGSAAIQASASLCGVDLWVEVFHKDKGIDMVVSFDSIEARGVTPSAQIPEFLHNAFNAHFDACDHLLGGQVIFAIRKHWKRNFKLLDSGLEQLRFI